VYAFCIELLNTSLDLHVRVRLSRVKVRVRLKGRVSLRIRIRNRVNVMTCKSRLAQTTYAQKLLSIHY